MPKLKIYDVLFWLAVAAALVPWLFMQVPQSINADNLWMCEAPRRWLHGQTVIGGFCEPNPPPELFLYTVPVMLREVFSVPLHYGVFGYVAGLLVLWSMALYAILRRWNI